MASENQINPLLTKEYFHFLSEQERPDNLFDKFPETIDENSDIIDIITSNKDFSSLISHKDKLIIAFKSLKSDNNDDCKLLITKQPNFETQVTNLKPDTSSEARPPTNQILTIDIDQIIEAKGQTISTQEEIIAEAKMETYQSSQTQTKTQTASQTFFLQNFLLNKDLWNENKEQSEENPTFNNEQPQVKEKKDDLSEDEITDHEGDESMLLSHLMPSFHKHRQNFPTSTEEPSKVAKRAEELSNRANAFTNSINLSADPQTPTS